jgi:hypothetical protein
MLIDGAELLAAGQQGEDVSAIERRSAAVPSVDQRQAIADRENLQLRHPVQAGPAVLLVCGKA